MLMEKIVLPPERDVYITTEINKFIHSEGCMAKHASFIEADSIDCPCMCRPRWLELTNRKRQSPISDKEIVAWIKHHKHDGKIYHYFMTWTTNPKLSCADTTRKNFKRFLERADTLMIERVDYVEEHIDANFHIHAYVKSHKTIHKKHIAHYQRYGKIDLQKAKGSFEEIIDYISKENAPTTFYGKIGTMGQG